MSGHSRPASYEIAYGEMTEAVEDMFAAHGDRRAECRHLIRRAAVAYREEAERETVRFLAMLRRSALRELNGERA